MDIITNNLPEFVAIAVAFAGFGIFNLANFLNKQINSILTNGTSVTGNITGYFRVKNSSGYNYQFTDHKNQTQSGTINGVSKGDFSEGQEIEIMYNVSNPKQSVYPPNVESKLKGIKILKIAAIVEMTAMPIIMYVILKFVAQI